EYGLIGTLEQPKIYGAGLLSSIGESSTCMKKDVAKLWYTIDAVKYSYDITKPQPQLFVTPDFQNLINVLEEFADTMAFRKGGAYGLKKAIESKNTCTVVYSSGLQVSGIVTDFKTDAGGKPYFIKITGPTALALNNKQLKGHGKDYHKDGFSSPVGKLKDHHDVALEDFSENDLTAAGVVTGLETELHFESGVRVKGRVRDIFSSDSKIRLITFEEVTVTDKKGTVLFDPAWGVYDMAVGEEIISVFCGAADREAYETIVYKSKTETHHATHDHKTKELQKLYQQVRDCRVNHGDYGFLGNVWQQLQKDYHDDWLCALEILEILDHEGIEPELVAGIKYFLEQKGRTEPEYGKLISDGFYLIRHPVEQKLVV
ncbi:MAG: aromatic amino acid hydroxylase, partial [Mucilaginibacter sp.]|nr:aromatic amino acid hydroxylase [Mucilaginibacter sp.]